MTLKVTSRGSQKTHKKKQTDTYFSPTLRPDWGSKRPSSRSLWRFRCKFGTTPRSCQQTATCWWRRCGRFPSWTLGGLPMSTTPHSVWKVISNWVKKHNGLLTIRKVFHIVSYLASKRFVFDLFWVLINYYGNLTSFFFLHFFFYSIQLL